MAYFDFEPEERFRSTWAPIIDVYERPDAVIVRVELPGVDKSDVRVRWRNNVLEITGVKHRETSKKEKGRYMCVERQHGRFRRDIAISTSIDFRHTTAELRNGLLKIRLPKLVDQSGDAFIRID
jgi:HSP20 family protein